jgi:DNA-3-methyladenine glycosylase
VRLAVVPTAASGTPVGTIPQLRGRTDSKSVLRGIPPQLIRVPSRPFAVPLSIRVPDRHSDFVIRHFFMRDPVTCSRELIGCTLNWKHCAGIIVETEAYSVVDDEACHTFARPSARAFVAKHRPGAAYVYFNYGMHWMLNVLVKGGSEDGFVLIRAIEPTRGIHLMARRRFPNSAPGGHPIRALCSGPGKLASALGVDRRDHGRDLCRGGSIGFIAPENPIKVVADIRIGISKAAHFPWRFLAAENPFVSVKPRRPIP